MPITGGNSTCPLGPFGPDVLVYGHIPINALSELLASVCPHWRCSSDRTPTEAAAALAVGFSRFVDTPLERMTQQEWLTMMLLHHGQRGAPLSHWSLLAIVKVGLVCIASQRGELSKAATMEAQLLAPVASSSDPAAPTCDERTVQAEQLDPKSGKIPRMLPDASDVLSKALPSQDLPAGASAESDALKHAASRPVVGASGDGFSHPPQLTRKRQD